MAVRFKKPGPLGRTFIAEWRRYRKLSQDTLAELIGISKPTLSRIESRKSPYGQDFIEVCAEKLNCTPADLISRDPEAAEPVLAIWERIPPAERPRALEVLRAFATPPATDTGAPRRAQGGRR